MKLEINTNKLTPELVDELVELWVRILRAEVTEQKELAERERKALAALDESQRRSAARRTEWDRDRTVALERRAAELTKQACESVRKAVEGLEAAKVIAAFEASAAPKDLSCTLPPPGWWCSRPPGHEGPCAARAKPSS